MLQRVNSFLSSKWALVISLGLLAAQSVWLAFTAIYPLPFDEYYHVGVIQYYTNQWLPFIAEQPAEASIYGDMTRDVSYLYHYLMSFPYRFLELFTANQTALVIMLRLVNVGFMAGAVVLFRKLLLEWGLSRRLTHLTLIAFVVTPIVPFLAAHVNYDNLMLLLTPVALLIATRLLKSGRDVLRRLLLLMIIGLLTSLIKINFLPVFLIMLAYVVAVLGWRKRHDLKGYIASMVKQLRLDRSFVLLALAFLLVSGLVIERYGYNLVKYGSVRTECSQVQPVEVCQNFMPWYRDHRNLLTKGTREGLYGNPVSFSQHWVSKIMRGYFAIFSHTPTEVVSDLEPFGPIVTKPLLPLQISAAYVVLFGGAAAILLQARRLWKHQFLRLGLVLCLAYAAVLWLFNYQTYLRLEAAQAIQARYTLPVLIPAFALLVWSLSRVITGRRLRFALIAAMTMTYVYGGGIAGYLIRADETWYWQNRAVIDTNQRLQAVLKRVIPH